jgi:hypothetical protein
MIAVLLTLLACEQPAALPATAVDLRPPPIGNLVQAGAVRGFLARPGEESPPTPAELRLVDALDPAAKDAALATAATGLVVLAVSPDIDPELAQAYLAGMPSTGHVTRTCVRRACP